MGYILGYVIGYLIGYTLNPEAFTATEPQLTCALERVGERIPTMIPISSPEIVPAFTRSTAACKAQHSPDKLLAALLVEIATENPKPYTCSCLLRG